MRFFSIGYIAIISLLFFSCGVKPADHQKDSSDSVITFSVAPAPEWTALFNRTKGWFGGDGIFAIPFSGVDSNSSDSVLFLFSDTMVGHIENGTLQPGFTMINNSVMILQGKEPSPERARFLVNEKADHTPTTLFIPTTPSVQKDDYYWLGDGFVNCSADSSLYIFAYRIRNTNDGSPFPFKEVGNSLIVIPHGSRYPFSDHRQIDLPFSASDSLQTSFGVGVLANSEAAGVPAPDGYIYVYGVRGKSKQLVAARVQAASVERFDTWEFYDGKKWAADFTTASPIADSVSNELSVTPVGNNQYALIYQYAGLMPTIYMQIGPTPVGPFGPRQKVWDTSGDVQEKNLFSYNAKAHPAISKPGELLVSYNVNSFDFFTQIKQIPNLYRPRFVRIVFNKK